MKASFINNENINGKAMINNYVDGIISFTNINDFAHLMLEKSITMATFKNSPAYYGQQKMWKNLKNVEQIQILGFDYDDGTPSQEIIETIKDYKHILAASTSHLKEKFNSSGVSQGIKERYHVFLFLEQAITDVEKYKIAVKWTEKHIIKKPSDKQAIEASRYFKTHSAILSVNSDGKFVPLNQINYEYSKILMLDKLSKTTQKRTYNGENGDITQTKRWKEKYADGLLSVGSRHRTMINAAGFCLYCGKSEYEAVEIIANATNKPDIKEIERAVAWRYAKG